MTHDMRRRDLLGLAGAGLMTAVAGTAPAQETRRGVVVGQREAAQAGEEMFAAGGNAVDAVVAAALAAGVVQPWMCGAGGYGGHALIAAPGRPTVVIDFNSAAPRAARADMFPLDANGQVRGRINAVGWLAAGVPGTLAGLQLALDRHGRLPLRRVIQPAAQLARHGVEVTSALVSTIRGAQAQLARDPGAARLLLPGGQPPRAGDTFRNPDLAALFETLARDNSVEAFYRGAIARQIAAAFAAHGGLVTSDDLADYRARALEPIAIRWGESRLETAPPSAGGLTVLQALATLEALDFRRRDPDDPRTTHLKVEALRMAWHDRLNLLGDPEKTSVPIARLLSPEYARASAARADEAVRQGRAVAAASDGRSADGTIHLSAGDSDGLMVALTLTHGASYGAQVAVDGLGLILGHGMSRFDPRPTHPNAPGPGKRPLHNMCPTIVAQGDQPILAVGGRGGRRIPNAVFEVLALAVGRRGSLEDALAARRLHTEGDMKLTLEPGWRAPDVALLRRIGYNVVEGASAVVSAVSRDPASGALRTASR